MSRQDKKVREIKKKGYKCQFYMNLSINWASLVAQMVKKKNLPAIWRPRFDPWVGNIPGEGMATHSSILAWETPRDRGA